MDDACGVDRGTVARRRRRKMTAKKEGDVLPPEGQACSRKGGGSCCSRVLGGFFLGAGIALLGYFAQQGAVKFAQIKQGPDFVRSKGFVSRRLKCDRAEWTIEFSGSGNDLEELVKTADERREQVMNFLKTQGFQTQDINTERSMTNRRDRHSDFHKTKWNTDLPKNRYEVDWAVVVSTRDVDKVVFSVGKFATFAGQYPADGDLKLRQSTSYSLDNLEVYRAEMIAAAAKSGREVAQKIVGDSGTVGRLLNAAQGDIRYADYSKPYRDAELVSYFKFEIVPK